MNETFSITRGVLEAAILAIESHSNNLQRCHEIALDSGDMLYEIGDTAIDELIDLLSSDNEKIVVLAILYLGILNATGLDAKRAITPIRSCVNLASPEMVKITGGESLAMLGDAAFVKIKAQHMAKRNLSQKDYDTRTFSTVVDFIAGKLK